MSPEKGIAKPKIAFFDFTGCEGCQLTVIDALQTNLELLETVEIVQFREAMSEKAEGYQIAFLEGSCTRPTDEVRLKAIRAKARIVVALGACAHLGGVNAVRNRLGLSRVKRYVYGQMGDSLESDRVRPIGAVVRVDAVIPGCPVDREEFIRAVKALLQGRPPAIPEYPLCVECKRQENACLFTMGRPCLGPIIRAGCGAVCPTFGVGCEGCRGMIPEANLPSLKAVLAEHGFKEAEAEERLRLFLSTQPLKSEV